MYLHKETCNEAVVRLETRVKRLEEALRPFAEMADGRKRKDIMGNVCFGQDTLLAARAALEDK